MSIKVISSNIRCISNDDILENTWDYRKDYLINLIKENNPDVFGLQEATPPQLEYFKEMFTEYNVEFKYRDDRPKTEAMPVFYRKDRFDLLWTDSFWLSETPNVMSKGWDASCYRICTCVKLFDKLANEEISVYNTHLDHRSETARVKGFEAMLKHIKDHDITGKIVVFGDFNAYEDSETIINLYNVFLDPARVSLKSDYPTKKITYQGYYKREEPVRIDYFGVSGFLCLEYKVIDNFYKDEVYDHIYPSDHFPIMAVLE